MSIEFPKVNNKLAFFDFDRTLVAHDYSRGFMSAREEGYFMECVWALTALTEEHAKDKPLPCMQWYAKKLYAEGYGLYCLTHEIFNLHDDLKKKQLALFYPDTPMTYLTVDSPEHKISMIRAIAMVEDCVLNDVIFVDDLIGTVNQALIAGIDAKHLSNIVTMYESQEGYHEQGILLRPTEDNNALDSISTMTEDVITELSERTQADIYEECRKLVELNDDVVHSHDFSYE